MPKSVWQTDMKWIVTVSLYHASVTVVCFIARLPQVLILILHITQFSWQTIEECRSIFDRTRTLRIFCQEMHMAWEMVIQWKEQYYVIFQIKTDMYERVMQLMAKYRRWTWFWHWSTLFIGRTTDSKPIATYRTMPRNSVIIIIERAIFFSARMCLL